MKHAKIVGCNLLEFLLLILAGLAVAPAEWESHGHTHLGRFSHPRFYYHYFYNLN